MVTAVLSTLPFLLLRSSPRCPVATASVELPIGAALEQATTAHELLEAAARITPPGPPFTMPHLAQDVHQCKRQSLAANTLVRPSSSLLPHSVIVGPRPPYLRHL